MKKKTRVKGAGRLSQQGPKRDVKVYDHRGKKRLSIPTEQTERDVDLEGREYAANVRPVGAKEPRLQWDRRCDMPGKEYAHALHIREKFSPQEMIMMLSKQKAQTKIFDDFNGFEPGSKYQYYSHKSRGKWQNRMIRGDSARVMATLGAFEGYRGAVQTIFFDPPYGIRFNSNYAPSMQGVKKAEVADRHMLTKDPITCEAFCDTWERGIDSYLDAILRRLNIMRDLLNNTGSVFVQIGSANVHKMALLLDEVFGHDNAVTTIMFKKSGGTTSSTIPEGSDFLLWYAKDKNQVKYHQLYEPLTRQELVESKISYIMLEKPDKSSRRLTPEEKRDIKKIPDGYRLFYRDRLESQGEYAPRGDDYIWNGTTYKCSPGSQWRIGKAEMDKLAKMNRLISSGGGSLSWKKYESEIPGKKISNQWASMFRPQTLRYAVQTSELIIERCILMTSDPGDLV